MTPGIYFNHRHHPPAPEGIDDTLLHPGWMNTHTGLIFDPTNLQPHQICLEDIAHALSCENRYNGHAPFPYSVAQHSVLVAQLLKMQDFDTMTQMWGLMHDAAEAYIKDIPTGLKRYLPSYKELELRTEAVIFERFGLHGDMPKAVMDADMTMLACEREFLFPHTPQWPSLENYPPFPGINVTQWAQRTARALFIEKYEMLLIELYTVA